MTNGIFSNRAGIVTGVDIALFLLAPQASQITGQTLVVDGRWSAISPTPSLDFVQRSI